MYIVMKRNLCLLRTETGTAMVIQNLMAIQLKKKHLPTSTNSLVPFPKMILSALRVTQSSMP